MDNKLISPLVQQQQRMSELIYSGTEADNLDDWRCSGRIPKAVALGIYQRNLHVGAAQHLQTHFPVMHAYIGELAYQLICANYLKASPPDQPIFTVYAAHFPGFLQEYGEQNSQQLIWSVAARLAQIDFFHHNTFCENQRIVVDDNYYQLWINTKSIMDANEARDNDGLYRQLELHPEHYQQQISKPITLVTFWENEDLFFRVE